jgi:solute carrier family 45, member 1/2/4
MGFAIFSIYCIDFSINAGAYNMRIPVCLLTFHTVQAMDRALLVDVLPATEQERGNAWAGRMFGLGSIIGFFACVFLEHS